MSGDAVPVDPGRLSLGGWDPARETRVGEGDIAGSYSADRIGMGRPIRRPFRWHGELWVCTGLRGPGKGFAAEAYRLVPPLEGAPPTTSYEDKTRDAAAARADPLGFYHGITVWRRGEPHVLVGPPRTFVAGEPSEPTLFAGLPRGR